MTRQQQEEYEKNLLEERARYDPNDYAMPEYNRSEYRSHFLAFSAVWSVITLVISGYLKNTMGADDPTFSWLFFIVIAGIVIALLWGIKDSNADDDTPTGLTTKKAVAAGWGLYHGVGFTAAFIVVMIVGIFSNEGTIDVMVLLGIVLGGALMGMICYALCKLVAIPFATDGFSLWKTRSKYNAYLIDQEWARVYDLIRMSRSALEAEERLQRMK